MPGDWLASLLDARKALAGTTSVDRPAFVMRHGTMRIGLYCPKETDRQTPHAQDEIYIVLAGTATVTVDADRRPCASGDVIFVSAGVNHRFEAFSKDFELCVVFWGPDGGERNAPPKDNLLPTGPPSLRP